MAQTGFINSQGMATRRDLEEIGTGDWGISRCDIKFIAPAKINPLERRRQGGNGHFCRSHFLVFFSVMPPAFSQCLLAPAGPGFSHGGMKYILTQHAYDASPNLPEEIRMDYGGSAQIADWQVLKGALSDGAEMQEFIAATGIPFQEKGGPCNNIFVSNGGDMELAGGITFFARHDGLDESAYYAVFDTIGHHTLDLGRWHHRSQALVIMPEEEESSKQTLIDTLSSSNRMFGGLMCLLAQALLLYYRPEKRAWSALSR